MRSKPDRRYPLQRWAERHTDKPSYDSPARALKARDALPLRYLRCRPIHVSRLIDSAKSIKEGGSMIGIRASAR